MIRITEWIDAHLAGGATATAAELTEQYLADQTLEDWYREAAIRRQVTEDVRAALRRKKANGAPAYVSLTLADALGDVEQIYEATGAAMPVPHYQQAVNVKAMEMDALRQSAYALIDECLVLHGKQLSFPYARPDALPSASAPVPNSPDPHKPPSASMVH